MTKSVTYQMCSHDPNNYGTVSFNPTIPWNTFKVEYKVTNVNTFSNFLITTKDDYIKIRIIDGTNNVERVYHFQDKSSYDIDSLAQDLMNQFTGSGLNVNHNNSGVLEITKPGSSFEIIECTHRVQLLMGIYHMKLPIRSDNNNTIICASTPMVSYGNLLYLKSHQGNSVGMMIDDRNYHSPCIYRINSYLKSGIPLIADKKGDKIIVNAEAAKTITMQLVDFMYEPIVLKSPMFVTVKIKMIPNESFMV